MLQNLIKVDFVPQTQRLRMTGGFHLLDVMRSFPSRRFDNKTKSWMMPLVKQNINHMRQLAHVEFELTNAAAEAIDDLDKLTARPVHVPFPYEYFELFGLKCRPMEHQLAMLDRAWSINTFALFAAMGTGKTFVTVSTAMARHAAGLIRSLFIICPETLRRTWVKEFNKWANPDKFTLRYHRSNDTGLDGWMKTDAERLHVLLISVEGLGISEKLAKSVFNFLSYNPPERTMGVVDESSRIKNPDAVRTKRAQSLGAHAKYKIILNGTPIAKGIHDLWAQYEFLDPNIIGSGDYWAFKTRYVVMGGWENKQIVGYQHVEELMKLILPYSLEVNKDVLNLPPKLPKTIVVTPTAEQERLMKMILRGTAVGNDYVKIENVLERMLRLQQIVGGFHPTTNPETDVTTVKPLDENPKMKTLLELIDDHYVGSKFVIWARYISEIEMILSVLRKKYGAAAVVDYYGGTSAADRAAAEDRYCNDPTCRILVGNPSAAGIGLTFIGGETDVMVYYSGTFAYIDRAQSEDRCHRIGQKNTVPIIDLVMEGTIDVAIQAAIAAKQDMDSFVKEFIRSGQSLESILSMGDGQPAPSVI